MHANKVLASVRAKIRSGDSSTDGLVWAVQAVCEVCKIPYGEVWQRYRAGTALRLTGAWHEPRAELEAFLKASRKFAFATGVGLPGRVWQSREQEFIRYIDKSADFSRTSLTVAAGLKEALGLPIISNEDVLAVLVFFDVPQLHPPGLFDDIAIAIAAWAQPTRIKRTRPSQRGFMAHGLFER